MKLNIAYPATGGQKVLDVTDEHRIAQFIEKKMGQEVDGAVLGDDFKGYVFRISGGNDKQGFPMKQGILTPNRVRVMLKKGDKCFRERRSGERKRKSIRGCIVSRDICILDLIVVKKGTKEIEGITDVRKPRRIGPKRAGKIRKLFGLSKTADVRKYVVRHKVVNKKGKEKSKAPKIQRLITPLRLKRKKYLETQKVKSATKTHTDLAAYKKLLLGRQKAERQALLQAARLKKEKKQKKEEEKKNQGKKKVVPATTKAKAKTTAATAVKAKAKTAAATAVKAKAVTAKGKAPAGKDVKAEAAAKAKGKAKTAAAAPAAKGKKETEKTAAAPKTAAAKGKGKAAAAAPVKGKAPAPAPAAAKSAGKKAAQPPAAAAGKTAAKAPAKKADTTSKGAKPAAAKEKAPAATKAPAAAKKPAAGKK